MSASPFFRAIRIVFNLQVNLIRLFILLVIRRFRIPAIKDPTVYDYFLQLFRNEFTWHKGKLAMIFNGVFIDRLILLNTV